MTLKRFFGAMLFASLATVSPVYGQFFQQGPKLVGTGAIGLALQGSSVAISADGNTAIEGGLEDNSGVGAVWIFTRTNGVWNQQGPKLIGTGVSGNDEQGFYVAISADGNTAIENGWVFTRSNGVWSQQGPKLVGSGENSAIIQSVGLSADGNTAVTGGDNGIWIFTRSNGVWTQQGNKLVGTGASPGSITPSQGFSVAISGDGNTVAETSPSDNNLIGALWIFTRTNGVWSQQGNKLVGTFASEEGFGTALSTDGSTVITGGVGGSWIFTRSNGVWSQQAFRLVGRDATSSEVTAVGLSGDGSTAILGSSVDNGSIGAAFIFIRMGGVWFQLGNKLVGSDSAVLPEQGQAVALSADANTALVGGPYDNGCTLIPPCPAPGASWVYARVASPVLYILDSGNGVIWMYDTHGNPAFYGGRAAPSAQTSGIAIDSSGFLWGTDSSLNEVVKQNGNGEAVFQFGTTGRAPGQLYQPTGIAIDSLGNVWIADTGNNRVEEFDGNGNFLRQFGGLGGTNGQFNAPAGIAIDASGNVWVADTGNNRIQKFDSSGNFLLKFGSFGNAGGLFEGPFSIAFDASGNAWIADPFNQRIQEFTSNGVFLQAVTGGFSFPSPYGVAVDSLGGIWGVDYNLSHIVEFNSSGAKVFQFGTIGGLGVGQFYHPTYIVAK